MLPLSDTARPTSELGMLVVGDSAKGRPLSTIHSQEKFGEAPLGCARPPTGLYTPGMVRGTSVTVGK